MDNTLVQTVVNDARTLAKTAEDDAKAAAVTLLTHVASGLQGDVPTLTDEAANNLFTFVPAAYRQSIEDLLKPGEKTLDDVAITSIKTGLGWVLNRIAAIPEVTVAAPQTAASAEATTAAPAA